VKDPDTDSDEVGQSFQNKSAVQLASVRRLQIFGQGAQLGNKYRFCMGMTDRPLSATNFDAILSCLMLWELKSIDVSQELPVKFAAP
jgi:hypothetical protein